MPAIHKLWTIDAYSPAETCALGATLGRAVQPGQVIALHGDLGAGKTTFTQGIAAGLGVAARVTSPTFILVNEYTGSRGLRLVHVDAYRLGDLPVQESTALGLDELLDAALPDASHPGGVVVIEWAERVHDLLPDDHLDVVFVAAEGAEGKRTLTFTAYGAQSAALLSSLMVEQLS
jgi:tRNA threonylcarbamoyladenosine biosynthesis protein TsaE